MKYLIVGLGNVGAEYEGTRHNIGFEVVDALAHELKSKFELNRHAFVAHARYAGKPLVILKPTTFMNLSGKALKYWMEQEKIGLNNVIVVLDDLALPFNKLRMRKKGGDGNHNGLSDIIRVLGRNDFTRIRYGIGNDFARGYQSDYVLGNFSRDERKELQDGINIGVEMIKSFIKNGVNQAMNKYN